MVKRPKVSVIMSCFNASAYLKEAIERVLNQSLCNFEFIIVDDGSSDETFSLIKSFQDTRIHIIRLRKNRGLAVGLNKAISLAKGKYLIRMDADDISLPERLKKQVKFMDLHPEIGISGTWISNTGTDFSVSKKPIDPMQLQAMVLFGNPFFHPTVIMRSKSLRKYGLSYDSHFHFGQDYVLWSRCPREIGFGNLAEPLLLYRRHLGQVSKIHQAYHQKVTKLVYRKLILQLGLKASQENLKTHWEVGSGKLRLDDKFLLKAGFWLKCLLEANRKIRHYDSDGLKTVIGKKWLNTCRRCLSPELLVIKIFFQGPFCIRDQSLAGISEFVFKCVKGELNKQFIHPKKNQIPRC